MTRGDKQYKAIVARAKRANQTRWKSLWAIADAILELAPPAANGSWANEGKRGPRRYSGRYALIDALKEDAELDYHRDTLRTMAMVAQAFPPEKRKRAAFSVHQKLMDRPELVQDGMTCDQACVAADKRLPISRPHPELTSAEALKAALRFTHAGLARLPGNPQEYSEELLTTAGLLIGEIEALERALDMDDVAA